MRALSLSAYAAGSHEHWQRCLEKMLPQWDWRCLSLPPRHFNWRVRGNPLYWSLAEREILLQPYDVLVATSLVDLVPELARLPTLLYFHENQFDYPQRDGAQGILEAQMVSIYSALCASRVVFNSVYNRDTFLKGVRELLARLPDYAPAEAADLIRERCSVLAVPHDVPGDEPATGAEAGVWSPRLAPFSPLRLVWVGRFEHDKGGETLLSILRELEVRGLEYEVAVVGQQFRQVPEAFAAIEREFGARLRQFGFLQSRDDYFQLLHCADMVLSTALHEFQGLAVMEAVTCGCLPVLPARQAYPGLYPSHCLYDGGVDDPEAGARAAVERIVAGAEELRSANASVPDLGAYSLTAMAPQYDALMAQLCALQDSQFR